MALVALGGLFALAPWVVETFEVVDKEALVEEPQLRG